ncbi:SatD family protein [Pseudalkalibacillus sp. SCS-8]|uniref:SatD family protein n=1 Tax=Pseudalkalibacillus nanhaiensis TaxID=3115291 RepID=UPI0032DB14C5
MVMQSCVCIASDVKDSRKKNKTELLESLMSCIKSLNDTYKEDLLVDFDIRNGDELIGVVKSFKKSYEIAVTMKSILQKSNITLYIGLGLGELETSNPTIHTMNGSAILNAFDARDRFLKEKHPDSKHWILDEKESSLFFYGKGYPYQALNALHFAIQEKKEKRSDKQNEVISLVKKKPDATYEQIGKELGYKSAKSTVSYLLSRAQFHIVNEMEKGLTDLLRNLQTERRKGGQNDA